MRDVPKDTGEPSHDDPPAGNTKNMELQPTGTVGMVSGTSSLYILLYSY